MFWDEGLDEKSATYKLASSDSRIIRSVAGPGSGKTFAIKRRIIRLLENGIDPQKVLAITFTRAAAANLRKEIEDLGIKGCEKVIARTVHSHAFLIVCQSEVKTIYSRNPRMVIEHETDPALRDIEFPVGTKIPERKKILESYESAWANSQQEEPGLPRNEIEEEFQSRITDWLKYHQGMMIGEVIPIVLNYLQNNPASPEIGKYDIILVDEYQDLNKAEQEFIKILAGEKNIVIVGDDDQSIYGFKNAHPEGIREIRDYYGDYDDIIFSTIRRCPKYVTRIASSLIAKNTNRILGKLTPYEHNQEGIVHIVQWQNNHQEIDGIVTIIKNEIEKKLVKPEEILILSPRRIFGYKIADILKINGIPAKSYFREDVIKNKNVQRAYSLLYLLAYPDDKISIRYLLGCKANDFRLNQYKKLRAYVDTHNVTIRYTLDNILAEKIIITGINNLLNDYREILNDLAILKRRLLENAENVFEYFYRNEDEGIEFYEIVSLFHEILLSNPLETKDDDEYISRWIKNVISKLAESISLPDNPNDNEHIRIMSLHSSKGLSAKFVILLSMIDELIPFFSNNDLRSEIEILEEQRRLFYVAMTRCKSSENDYPGRLLISSFMWIQGIDALRIGLKANPYNQRRTQSTRYLNDLGREKPKVILGQNLLSEITKT